MSETQAIPGNAMECEGNCDPHEGEVRYYHVNGYRLDWGRWRYCEAAAKRDRENGFDVIEVDHALEEEP